MMDPVPQAVGGPRRLFSPLRWVALGVSGLIVYGLLRRLDRGSVMLVLREARPEWLIACVLAQGGALACGAWRWHQMLRLRGVSIGRITSLKWTLIGHGFSAFLFGAAVSDVAKSTLYSRWRGFPMSTVLAASVLDRTAGVLSTGLYALATLAAAMMATPRLPEWELPQWFAERWGLLALVVATTLVTTGYWVRSRWLPRLRVFWRELSATGTALWARPGLTALAVCAGLMTQILISLVLACALHAVAPAPDDWVPMLWTFPMIGVVASLPVTLSGAGAREGAAIFFWAPFGVPAASAFGAGLLTLSANLFWAMLGVIVLWWEARRMKTAVTLYPSSPSAR